jgi:hypothetical protein
MNFRTRSQGVEVPAGDPRRAQRRIAELVDVKSTECIIRTADMFGSVPAGQPTLADACEAPVATSRVHGL